MKSSKKVLLFLIMIISIFGITNVKALGKDIKVTDVSIKDKSGTISVADPVITNDEITSNVTFNKVDDFVTFELEVKNNENEKYKIESIKDNNTNNNIKIDYTFSKDYISKGETSKVTLKLTYKNKLINQDKVDINDLTIKISFISEDGDSEEIIINPTTGDNILHYIVLLIIALTGLLLIAMNKKLFKIKIGRLLVVLAIILLPLAAIAKEKYEINIKFKDIVVKGEFEKYNITISPGNGSEPIVKEVTYGQKIGDLPADPSKDGYTFDKWVDEKGNEVTKDTVITKEISVIASYNLVTYNISYDLDDGSLPSGKSNPETYTIESQSISLNNPEKRGYIFAGWSGTGIDGQTTEVTIDHGSKGDRSYKAHYLAKDDTKYTVIHKFAKLNGEYDTEEVIEHGTTGSTVPAPRKTRTGFVTPTVQNVTIEADGSAEITYTYERETYSFSITDRTYIDESVSTPNDTYPYETSITVKALEREGYGFTWDDAETDYERTFELTGTTNLTPIYTAKTNTPYTVEHYKMKFAVDDYELAETQSLSGETDSPIIPAVNTYEGFTSPATQSTTIGGDGHTVVKYYYTRNTQTVTINNPENIVEGDLSGEYYYGQEITLTAKTIEGKTFTKWSNDETDNSITITVGTEDIEIGPIYNGDQVTVTFNTDGGSEIASQTIDYGTKITRPTTDPTKEGYTFDNWYTSDTYKTKFDFNTSIISDTVIYAHFAKSLAICEENINITKLSDNTCTENENITVGDGIVCKRAIKLHQETCEQTNTYGFSNYCEGAGYSYGDLMTYGSCGTSGTLYSGDALTCDVNGDGDFDELTERFYYVSDYYNPNTKEFESDTATLIYYNNVSNGITCNKSKYSYSHNEDIEEIGETCGDTNGCSWYGPLTIIKQLPTTSQWENVSLKNTQRQLLTERGTTKISNKNLPVFNMENYSTRFLTAQELVNGWYISSTLNYERGSLDYCSYLFENTEYANNSLFSFGLWLETLYSNETYAAWYIQVYARTTHRSVVGNNGSNAVRPVIDVPKNKIALGEKNTYTLKYNGNGSVIKPSSKEIKKGDPIGDLPIPTPPENKDFVGWYTDLYDGIKVTSDYVINSDVTIYARYINKLSVTFNTDGGSSIDSQMVSYGEKVTRPTTDPTKTNYIFINWYTNKNYDTLFDFENALITSDTVIYAKFEEDSFPEVFSEPGECTFNGSNGVLTGDNCSYANGTNKYIDTGINLYNSENHDKDYEIGFTIVSYNPSEQTGQATFMNTKLEGSNYPGLVFRKRNGYSQFDLSSRKSSSANEIKYMSDSGVETVKIYRITNEDTGVQEIFYSINDEEKVKVNDLSQFNPEFNLSVWFGAAPTNASATAAQRYLVNTTLKDIYIKLGTYQESSSTDKYKVTYNANGGSVSPTSKTINIGDQIGTLPTPTPPTNKTFDGWYTELTGGIEVTSTYVPNNNMTIYARYYNDISGATISPSSISIINGSNQTITVSNVEEEYTFSSNDTNIATVDSTGKVTGTSVGTTTITITGSTSGKTRTINVTVEPTTYTVTLNANGGSVNPTSITVNNGDSVGTLPEPTPPTNKTFDGWYTELTGGVKVTSSYTPNSNITIYARYKNPTYTISFDAGEGSAVNDIEVEQGNSIGTLPTSTRNGYILEGWYEENTYETKVTSSTIPTGNVTYYAKWEELKVHPDNENITSLSETTCSANENITVGDGIVCKRAVKLHEETCSQTSGTYYCSGAGYTTSGSKGTSTITYGSCGTSGTLTSGDAFTCDVNGDGEFDELTERFYYVSDYFDTSAKEFDDSTAVLIYYNNVTSGVSCNKNKYAYDSSNTNYNGPRTLITQLPTTSQWSNVTLKNETRQILTETGTTSTSGGTLPTNYSYSGYAARFLTAQELNSACGITIGNVITGELDGCNYVMENTKYAKSSIGSYGGWLETPRSSNSFNVWYVYGFDRTVYNYVNASDFYNYGARPAIEVLKSKISY